MKSEEPPRHAKAYMEGDFLKSEDLFPYDWNVTITRVWDDLPPKRSKKDRPKRKIFIQLKEFPKPWIINGTNCDRLISRIHWDRNHWVGKVITIYAKEGVRQMGGGTGMGIRIRPIEGESE